MKSGLTRQLLFDLYSNNLKFFLELNNIKIKSKNELNELVELDEPAIFCPVCMSLFKEAFLQNDNSDQLTIEHIPPESVGGRGKILTCKTCNEKLGQQLDHHIQRALNVEPFLRGTPNSIVEGKVWIDNSIPLKTKLSYEKNKLSLLLTYDKNIKGHYLNLKNNIQEKWDGVQFKVKFQGSNKKKYHLALVKSAYLEMFKVFGHTFLFSQSAIKIREQINNSYKEILPHSSIIEQNFQDKFIGINLVKDSLDNICFLVVFNLKIKQNNYNKKIGVLIPGPDEKGWETYCSFKNGREFSPRLIHIPNLNFIKEKSSTLAFNEIWEDAKYSLL